MPSQPPSHSTRALHSIAVEHGGPSPASLGRAHISDKKEQHTISITDQQRWQKVKEQLRHQLGEDVFTSWFGRMELEAVEKEAVRLSEPTRFLRTWIQSPSSEHVLARGQAEEPAITRLELSVRSAALRPPVAKPKAAEPTL